MTGSLKVVDRAPRTAREPVHTRQPKRPVTRMGQPTETAMREPSIQENVVTPRFERNAQSLSRVVPAAD